MDTVRTGEIDVRRIITLDDKSDFTSIDFDALDALRIVTVDRDSRVITLNFDAMHGMSPEQRFWAMIAVGRYDLIHSGAVTPKRFPIPDSGIARFRPKLFIEHYRFGSFGLLQDAVNTMRKEKFRPGTHIHGLAYCAVFRDELRAGPITCPGWPLRRSKNNLRSILYFWEVEGKRCIDTTFDHGCGEYCQHLGVQNIRRKPALAS
jgi:hypothetical protein